MTTPRNPLPQAALQEIDRALIALASASRKLEPLMADEQDLATVAWASKADSEINRAIVALERAKGTARKGR